MVHEIRKIRHDLRRRSLTVRTVERITPKMARITLHGPDLEGFVSLAPDDHIKLFIPAAGGALARRDFTPRKFDADKGWLTLDFALHDAGPATQWASAAKPGDLLDIGGPKGSSVVPHDFDWWLLIGDETALPAIGRQLEELPAGKPVTTIVAITDAAEQQAIVTAADHSALWCYRPAAAADDPAPLLAAIRNLKKPRGDGFVWIAAETKVARAARELIVSHWSHPPKWLKASGYWAKGRADAGEKIAEPDGR